MERAGSPARPSTPALGSPRELAHDSQVYRAYHAPRGDCGGRRPGATRRPRLRVEARVPAVPAGAEPRREDSDGRPDREADEIRAWATTRAAVLRRQRPLPRRAHRVRGPRRADCATRTSRSSPATTAAPTRRRRLALDSPATAAGSEAPAAEAGAGGPPNRAWRRAYCDDHPSSMTAGTSVARSPKGQQRWPASASPSAGPVPRHGDGARRRVRRAAVLRFRRHRTRAEDARLHRELLLHEFAREIRPGALHRGRLYHVHHKRLYAAIGETDNRNRKPSSARTPGRAADAARRRAGRPRTPVAGHRDRQVALRRAAVPRAPAREEGAAARGVRQRRGADAAAVPDKLPIGVIREGADHVFVYLARRRSPVDLRACIVRHAVFLKALHRWTIRVLMPKPFAKALPLYKRAIFEELARPLHPSEADELGWFFKERVRACEMTAWVPDARFAEARKRFNAPRFRMLHRLWQRTARPFFGTRSRQSWPTSSNAAGAAWSSSSSRGSISISRPW